MHDTNSRDHSIRPNRNFPPSDDSSTITCRFTQTRERIVRESIATGRFRYVAIAIWPLSSRIIFRDRPPPKGHHNCSFEQPVYYDFPFVAWKSASRPGCGRPWITGDPFSALIAMRLHVYGLIFQPAPRVTPSEPRAAFYLLETQGKCCPLSIPEILLPDTVLLRRDRLASRESRLLHLIKRFRTISGEFICKWHVQ